MKRISVIGNAVALAVGVYVAVMASRSAAEPIPAEESFAAPSADTTQKPEAVDAIALFKARDYDGSLKLWREAAKKNENFPPAQTIMAQLYLQTNMLKEAQLALEQATIEDPADPEAYLILASLAMRDRDANKAESLYQKASGLTASFQKSAKRKEMLQLLIHRGFATLAESRKDWPAAQKALEETLKLDPKNRATMQRIAYYLFQQKNSDGALAKLREAAKDAKDALTPEVILAQFAERSGDRQSAAKWMAAAVTAAPKDLKTRLTIGQWAMETGQLDEAQKHAIAATQIAPKSLDAKLFRGTIALLQKDYAAAESIFEAAVKQEPKNVIATNNLALALISQDDETKGNRALELAEANAKQLPKMPEIASTYGLILYKLGRIDQAEKALKTAAPIANFDVDTAYTIARISVDRGHKAEARQMLELALKNPKPFMLRQEAEDLLEQLKKPDADGTKK